MTNNTETNQNTKTPKKGRLLIVSGPSGVGKGTLLRQVFAQSGFPLVLSVSATTRVPRPGEQNGVHYHFLTKDDFQAKIQNEEFLEFFEVFGTGYWYGTLRKEVEKGLAQGHWVVLEIDVKGAGTVKKAHPEALTFFVEPKSIDVLKERLRGRGTETDAAMAKRLETAIEELGHADEFQYRIVNDDLDTAVKEMIEHLKKIDRQ